MCKTLYLVCLNSPFEQEPFLFCKNEEHITFQRDVSIICGYDRIICYGFQDIINNLRRRNIEITMEILDIVTAKKLLIGRPKASFEKRGKPWDLRYILGKESSKVTLKWLNKIIQLELIVPEQYDDFENRLIDLMSAFQRSWGQLEEELSAQEESKRFLKVEVPIYKLFLLTQYRGIRVSQENLNKKLSELRRNYYFSIKNLEIDHDFISQKIKYSIKWKDVEEYTSVSWQGGEIDYDFWRYAEILSEYDSFFLNLVTARYSNIDYNALLKYRIDSYNKIYPTFDVIGTVTGRVLVTTPGIQYLRKTSRSIFDAEEGNCFIYADFDQFEPGIVAHFSSDSKLIDLYNKGDVYEELSMILFGSKEKRKIAKIVFLSFIYGMKKENLERFISNIADEEAAKLAQHFFTEFNDLFIWREDVCVKALENGYSVSVFGNRRYTEHGASLTAKEKRWIPNQIIQGTASYIFKESLLRLDKKLDYVHFLVPMHDAILIEVPIEKEDESKNAIREVFNSVFQEICPSIKTNVSFEDFLE